MRLASSNVSSRQEADVGRELEVHRLRNLARGCSACCGSSASMHRGHVLAAQRDHVGGGELEVRRQPHLGHGDDVRCDDVIVDFAARQHLGQLVADQLADA